jgi:hypothetical protein
MLRLPRTTHGTGCGSGPGGPASKPKTPFLAQRRVVVTVVVLFAALMANTLRRGDGVQPAPEVEEAAVEFSLLFAAEAVKQYRDEHGVLPSSLSAVGLSDERYQYRPGRDGSFELASADGSQSLRHDGSESTVDILRAMTTSPGGGR